MSRLLIKDKILLNIKNLPGPRTNRKIVVIECDDWGGIRMPSRRVYDLLIEKGLISPGDRYAKNDTLADKVDLEYLFDVLLSFKDRYGANAVMTPVTNVANPDFKRIKEAGFTEYFYEPFTYTLKKYSRHPDTFNTWMKGMELKIFVPEFHGREHISVHFWLQALSAKNSKLRFAFDNEVVSVKEKGLHPALDGFRPEFYFNSPDQKGYLKDSISDGINLFRNIFGYTPRAFIPSNSIFHPDFENTVYESDVKYLFVSHFNPIPDNNGKIVYKFYPSGKRNPYGLSYYTRNCAFEPTEPKYSGIELTMKQIEAAFRWGKPANISTHRVNFIGTLNEGNREKGLREMRSLLKAIVNRWPDVEFMSSADMFRVVYEKN